MARAIEIIKYPFSLGAALNRSFSAPDIVQAISEDLLSSAVTNWKELPTFKKAPSQRRYKKLRNYVAVREAITLLGTEIGKSQWSGNKTLTLGGDHTQGIATVKASALILIAKAIISGGITCKDKNAATALQKAGDQGQIEKLGQLISSYTAQGAISKKALKKFLNTITVIWIDSHADYNNRHTSSSGNIHGMALAACTGHDIGGIENLFAGDVIKLNPKNLYVLCARDIDPAERRLMNEDGVNYKDWEMTHPGRMRSYTDSQNPMTLKKALNAILKSTKDQHLIFSMDIDAIHAGPHNSPYGTESVAATGTPMGLRARELKNILRQTTHKDADTFIRRNALEESPPGPTAGDVFEALQGIMMKKNVIAADLSEISPAAGTQGNPVSEKQRGLTLQTSTKILAAMLAQDLGKFSKSLKKKNPLLGKLVKAAVHSERTSQKQ